MTAGAAGAGASVLGVSPSRLQASTDDLNKFPEPTPGLVAHCRRILEQNLLKAGETFVIATPPSYDAEYMTAMLTAAGEIGALGAHMAIFPKFQDGNMVQNLGEFHWRTYAQADLLITSGLGNTAGAPGASTAYGEKTFDHQYRTDYEFISRPGSKTRWLALGYSYRKQRQYFPTAERRERTRRGAILLDETRGQLRVTSQAGTDWRCTMFNRPGHAQYGIADMGGRWDNFGYGCVAFMPNEDSATGTLVLQPGDIITNLYPPVISEPVQLTFRGGYITNFEGGRTARQFQELLASYNNRESFGLSHFGWGTHEKTQLENYDDVGHYHHNQLGTLLFAMGMNFGHGVGGRETGYSGSGMSTRIAPNHTHFTMHNCDVYVAAEKIIERGVVAPKAGGLA